ncbi:hypothetical protein [Acidisoma sp.]|uniref:hypothetical protein n=1 Tax=Acidisoma sp. TaxID=1872115 RepID=UPI003B00262E
MARPSNAEIQVGVLLRCRHPVSIVTKSASIVRDLDILEELAKLKLFHVYLSDDARSGACAGDGAAGLNDAELEAILEAAAEAGAERAGYVLLRLPLELREMFEAWLREHMPQRANHVLSLIRQMRGGALNDATFGQRFVGTGPYADLLSQRF